jgi:DNA-directed RNA polymerase specialized sigma subunit
MSTHEYAKHWGVMFDNYCRKRIEQLRQELKREPTDHEKAEEIWQSGEFPDNIHDEQDPSSAISYVRAKKF